MGMGVPEKNTTPQTPMHFVAFEQYLWSDVKKQFGTFRTSTDNRKNYFLECGARP